jgi:MinD-like ATPase involved in chromosome partitioning or flagellar assembly
MSNDPSGQIITFYSYKGGTGRTMALANMAWVLASNGKKVLVIDWDLEAPGLHRFLHPFLIDKELDSSEGVIDFVIDYVSSTLTPREARDDATAAGGYDPRTNILRYASSLEWSFFPGAGTVDYVPPGRQGPSYARRVNGFDWRRLYEELGGHQFIQDVRERLKFEYDYVLIDSRTGVSDTSGICTVDLPDSLVVCFTYNSQSISGASTVAESVAEQRAAKNYRGDIRVFPVPTRVELAEKTKLDAARTLAQDRFIKFLGHLDAEGKSRYWGEVEIPYTPFYAYEEILATFADTPGQTISLLAAIERLTSYVTNGQVAKLQPPPEAQRQQVLAQYTRERPTVSVGDQRGDTKADYQFFVSYARADADRLLVQFVRDLSEEVRLRAGLPMERVGFFDASTIEPGEQWDMQLREALQRSRVLVALYSPYYFASEYCGKEFGYSVARHQPILPVIWIPVQNVSLPPAAKNIQIFSSDAPAQYIKDGMRYVMRLSRSRDTYQILISQLANRIVELALRGSYNASADAPPDFSHLISAFPRASQSIPKLTGPT